MFSPDWTATLLELGGARPDPAYPLDGVSLAGYLLRGEEPKERDLFWRVRGERALRRGDWKYYRGRGGTDQLFQLAHDQREQADRAQAEPKLLAELRASWERTDSRPAAVLDGGLTHFPGAGAVALNPSPSAAVRVSVR